MIDIKNEIASKIAKVTKLNEEELKVILKYQWIIKMEIMHFHVLN